MKHYKVDIFTRLFYTLPAGFISRLPLNLISKIAGSFANTSFSRHFIPFFIKFFGVNLDDCIVTEKEKKSLNSFFTRPLKEEKMAFSPEPNDFISPAEGFYYHFSHLKEESFDVKGNPFFAKDFIGDTQISKKLEECDVAVVYLTPKNYHRFHLPIRCKILRSPYLIAGKLLSVNKVALDMFPDLYSINERLNYAFEDEAGNPLIFSAVGATMVGSITNSIKDIPEGTWLEKGTELGDFHFGGSTVVMVMPRGYIKHNKDVEGINDFLDAKPVRFGELLGAINAKD